MSRILLFAGALLLFVAGNSNAQCGCNFIINANSPYVFDGVKMGVKPGNKICFANGQRADIQIQNVHGTAAQPVTFTNMCDGKVVIKGTANTGRLMYMGNVSFVRVTGTGNSAEQYGIEIQTGVQGIDFRDLSTDVEADHLYVHDLSYSGINAKTDPTCDPSTWRGNFVMRNVLVHDNKINLTTGGEGIYIGESHYQTTVTVTPCNLQVQEHEIIGCQVYNNILTNIGRDGIQVGSATTNCSIHDNSITNFGTTHEQYDASGIQINPGTNAETYNNVINQGFGFGVFAGGEGASHLYNNIISNCGLGGICSAAYAPVNTSGFIFSNNTLINNANIGIQSYANTTPNTFVNNIIVAPATGSFKYVDANSPGIIWHESNNIKTNDITTVKFVDPASRNYHLQSGSPAKDAGISMVASGITFDLDHLPRPSGAAFDLGAYELQGGAANKPPVANAGADAIVTLPTSVATLKGTATDADGTISTWAWTKVSGPAATLTNAATATLTLSGLVQGSYDFRLTVTDNAGASASDDVLVTVNAAVNIPPVVNAGTDVVVISPITSATLKGTATDADGTISTWTWTKVSGPAASLTNAATSTLSLSGLVVGIYDFRLTVTDNSGASVYDDVLLTVSAAANKPPVANAGTDVIVNLPTATKTLTGTGSDPDGTISAWAWTKISGPAATLTNATTATLSLSGLVQGSYDFRLTVTDNSGATAYDDVLVTVNAAANVPPVANAGTDVIVTLPTTTKTLAGTATDTDGIISAWAWTKVSGPAATLTNATTPTLSLSGLVQGSYDFRLTVTDNSGATAFDDVVVTVNATNVPPVANAGTDVIVTLPTTTKILTGTASDTDGSISTWAWTKVSGPAATLTNATTATLSLSNLVQGSYDFRLTVTDNSGATAYDDVLVTVNPAVNQPPVANAGADVIVTVPATTKTLIGTASDPDGSISAWAWTKVSGPAATLTNAATATLSLSNLVEGSYDFRLTVTDNSGATAYDDVTVLVKAAGNLPPVVDAGADISITTTVTTLTGIASDPDGTVPYWDWTKVSGPAATMTDVTSHTVIISGLVQGTYVFRLTVTDNIGAVAHDDVNVIVNPGTGSTDPAVSRFNFTDETQNIAGWIDAVGSPHAAVATAKDLMTGFVVSSISTGQWPPLENATPNSSFHGGVTNGTVQPAAVVWTQWLNYGAPYGSIVNGVVQGDNISLSGLNPSKAYQLEMGASRASGSGPDRYGNVEYRVKGIDPKLLLITDNATNQVVYTNITSDAQGKIGISARKVNGDSPMEIGYIGWLVVTETGASTARTSATSAADIVPGSLSDTNDDFVFIGRHYPGNHQYRVRVFNDAGQVLYAGEWNESRYPEVFASQGLYLYNVFSEDARVDAGKVMIVR